ncbi:hypothetical protein EGO25_12045, partial [Neisseria gonorrhoeae]
PPNDSAVMMLNRVSIVLFPFGRFYGSGSDSRRFRHSRESGNPETPNAAGIYRKRLKPDGPDSRLRGNDGSVATVTVRFRSCWNFGKLMNRHSRRFPPTPPISVIPAKAGIRKPRTRRES